MLNTFTPLEKVILVFFKLYSQNKIMAVWNILDIKTNSHRKREKSLEMNKLAFV